MKRAPPRHIAVPTQRKAILRDKSAQKMPKAAKPTNLWSRKKQNGNKTWIPSCSKSNVLASLLAAAFIAFGGGASANERPDATVENLRAGASYVSYSDAGKGNGWNSVWKQEFECQAGAWGRCTGFELL